MIHSSASLAADDLSVRCRVRRSETASQPRFDEYCDMTCTMRTWKSTGSHSPERKGNGTNITTNSTLLGVIQGHNESELLLHPVKRQSSRNSDPGCPTMDVSGTGSRHGSRSGSRSRAGSRPRSGSQPRSRSGSVDRRKIWSELYEQAHEVKKVVEPYSIPIHDIVVVDALANGEPICLTTQSMGYFEFSFSTSNAHDVCLAFLSNALPRERITTATYDPALQVMEQSSSFDVEALTAERMEKCVKHETIGERLRRKMVLLSHRIGELSHNIADCACGGEGREVDTRSPASQTCTFDFPTELEVETGTTLIRTLSPP